MYLEFVARRTKDVEGRFSPHAEISLLRYLYQSFCLYRVNFKRESQEEVFRLLRLLQEKPLILEGLPPLGEGPGETKRAPPEGTFRVIDSISYYFPMRGRHAVYGCVEAPRGECLVGCARAGEVLRRLENVPEEIFLSASEELLVREMALLWGFDKFEETLLAQHIPSLKRSIEYFLMMFPEPPRFLTEEGEAIFCWSLADLERGQSTLLRVPSRASVGACFSPPDLNGRVQVSLSAGEKSVSRRYSSDARELEGSWEEGKLMTDWGKAFFAERGELSAFSLREKGGPAAQE